MRANRVGGVILRIVYTAVFFSGASALVYEIVWLRLLRLIFGDTVLAVSTLLAAFMAGLAIGSYVLGRVADLRPASSLRYYGFMEIGIGVYALLIPSLFELLSPAGVWITEQYRTSFYTLSLIRFALSLALLLPATMLMGGTLPVLIRQFARERLNADRNGGTLYAINTLGAGAGCLSAGFFLIGVWGVHSAILIAASFNMALGATVLVIAGKLDASNGREETRIETLHSRSPAEPCLLFALPWIYALSGFIALALEVVWIRMLAMFTSMHVQSFSVMLTILLFGIAVGSYIYTKWLAQRMDAIKWLVGSAAAIGVWTLVSVPLFRHIPPVPLPPHGPVPDLDAPAPVIALSMILPSLLLILIPALAMGVMFPLIVGFCEDSKDKVGRHVGRIYGLNTLGGIFGSFVGGFILLPVLGVHKSMVLLGSASIGIACVLLVASRGSRSRPIFGSAVAATGLFISIVAATNAATDEDPPVQGLKEPWKLIHYREGLTAGIRVFENAQTGVRELFSDSWYIASTEHAAMRLQRMLAHLPLLIHRQPEQLLIVGFGTGTTSGSSMLYDIHTDAVELESSEVETAKLFAHVNHDILDPKWRSKFALHFDDGRSWLLTNNAGYDVVSRDAHLAKPSQDLFSREFLMLAKRRLKPGGIFCGFLPPESTDAVKRMLAAFHSVFPNGSVWYISPIALLVVGTVEPLDIDYHLLRKRMSESDIKEDLRAVSFADPTDILSSFLMAGDDLGRFIDGTEPATDERPLGFLNSTDFGSPRDVIALSDDLIRHQTDIARYLHNIDDSPIVADAVRRELKAQSGALRHLIRGQLKLLIFRDVDAAQTEFLEALRWREDWMEAQFQYSLALAMKAENLLRNHDAGAAVELLQNAVKQGGQDDARQYVLLGRAFEELGQIALADENYRRASDLLKTMGYPQIPFLRQKLLKSTGQSLSKGR